MFNVDQDAVTQDIENASKGAAPEQSGEAPEGAAPNTKELTPAQEQELIDLDKVQKFKYGGREWTPKDFQGAVMMQSDYTKKTQAIAQERKYYDNLSADLEAVKGNPQLIDEFKKVYPEKFHSFLSYIQKEEQRQAKEAPQEQASDPAYKQFQSRIEQIENHFKEQEVSSINAELDNKFSQLSKKYDMADEESVLARAQTLVEKLQSENPGQKVKISDQQWDQLWKTVHDKAEAAFNARYTKQVQSKLQNNARAKDVPAGGGIPGQAPRKFETIREASDAYREVMEQQG